MTAKSRVFADRSAFIAYNSKQTKTWLCNAISQETGDDWSSRHDMTAKELATKLADLQGWTDQPEENSEEIIARDGLGVYYEIQAAAAEASIQDEIAAGNIEESDVPVSTDQPPAKAKKTKPAAEVVSIETLLARYKEATSPLVRKKIRVQLRAQGYRLSDHKQPTEPKPSKKSSRPKVKGKSK